MRLIDSSLPDWFEGNRLKAITVFLEPIPLSLAPAERHVRSSVVCCGNRFSTIPSVKVESIFHLSSARIVTRPTGRDGSQDFFLSHRPLLSVRPLLTGSAFTPFYLSLLSRPKRCRPTRRRCLRTELPVPKVHARSTRKCVAIEGDIKNGKKNKNPIQHGTAIPRRMTITVPTLCERMCLFSYTLCRKFVTAVSCLAGLRTHSLWRSGMPVCIFLKHR